MYPSLNLTPKWSIYIGSLQIDYSNVGSHKEANSYIIHLHIFSFYTKLNQRNWKEH